MEKEQKVFFFNLENRWPLFKLNGLEVDQEGSLTLARVPEVELGEEIALTPPDPLIVPAGIAVDKYGNIYLSDPSENQIFKYDICKDKTEPILGPLLQLSGNTHCSRSVLSGPGLAAETRDRRIGNGPFFRKCGYKFSSVEINQDLAAESNFILF